MEKKIKSHFISDARLNAYKDFDEYQDNIIISGKYYTLLCIFEISLRNAIDKYMQHKLSTNWLNNDLLHNDTKHRIQEAKKKILQRNESLSHDKIISELALGFWTSIFRKSYSNIMRINDIKHIFPNIPSKHHKLINRAFLDKKLNHIRKFRNKIFHYEKIIGKIEYQNIDNDIVELLRYFNDEVELLAKTIENRNDNGTNS